MKPSPVGAVRKECGLTQERCAKLMRWSLTTQARIERGRGDLDRHLRPLARLFTRLLGRVVTACYDLLGVPDPRRGAHTIIPFPQSGTNDAPGPSTRGNVGATARAGQRPRRVGV